MSNQRNIIYGKISHIRFLRSAIIFQITSPFEWCDNLVCYLQYDTLVGKMHDEMCICNIASDSIRNICKDDALVQLNDIDVGWQVCIYVPDPSEHFKKSKHGRQKRFHIVSNQCLIGHPRKNPFLLHDIMRNIIS